MRGRAYYIEFILCILFLTRPVQAQYCGGTGKPKDPYQIATAEDLVLLGDNPDDYDKHFILTADIDLNPNLAGGKVFTKAVIAPDPPCLNVFTRAAIASDQYIGRTSMGTPFTGTFDGNGYTISNLTITGGGYLGLFGFLGVGANIYNLGLEAVNVKGAGNSVGALAGCNYGGEIIMNCSTGTVTGIGSVGGLVGYNLQGNITMSYSTSEANGVRKVGGLVGSNRGSITSSYSTGIVTGDENIGGLVGENHEIVTLSFWNIRTSRQIISAGGEGKTTAEMQTADTFLDAGWDFAEESANGTNDIWWILEGQSYPRLWWQYGRAFSAYPQDGAADAPLPLILSWLPGGSGLQHDVYLGEDKETVANATTDSQGIYRGREAAETTTYDPCNLKLEKTYYWRIDEVNPADPNSPCKGDIWSFTTANFIVVDDFESYDADNHIWWTWNDGLGYVVPVGNFTGSAVGDETTPSYTEETIVHGGTQSMPYWYDNDKAGYAKYSEAEKTLSYPRDWTQDGILELSLWFHGNPSNAPEPMYVAVANRTGTHAVVYNHDPNAVRIDTWTEWIIPLQIFAEQGIDLTDIDRIAIGIGTRGNMTIPGGQGRMYFDDIRLYRPRPVISNDLEVNVP